MSFNRLKNTAASIVRSFDYMSNSDIADLERYPRSVKLNITLAGLSASLRSENLLRLFEIANAVKFTKMNVKDAQRIVKCFNSKTKAKIGFIDTSKSALEILVPGLKYLPERSILNVGFFSNNDDLLWLLSHLPSTLNSLLIFGNFAAVNFDVLAKTIQQGKCPHIVNIATFAKFINVFGMSRLQQLKSVAAQQRISFSLYKATVQELKQLDVPSASSSKDEKSTAAADSRPKRKFDGEDERPTKLLTSQHLVSNEKDSETKFREAFDRSLKSGINNFEKTCSVTQEYRMFFSQHIENLGGIYKVGMNIIIHKLAFGIDTTELEKMLIKYKNVSFEFRSTDDHQRVVFILLKKGFRYNAVITLTGMSEKDLTSLKDELLKQKKSEKILVFNATDSQKKLRAGTASALDSSLNATKKADKVGDKSSHLDEKLLPSSSSSAAAAAAPAPALIVIDRKSETQKTLNNMAAANTAPAAATAATTATTATQPRHSVADMSAALDAFECALTGTQSQSSKRSARFALAAAASVASAPTMIPVGTTALELLRPTTTKPTIATSHNPAANPNLVAAPAAPNPVRLAVAPQQPIYNSRVVAPLTHFRAPASEARAAVYTVAPVPYAAPIPNSGAPSIYQSVPAVAPLVSRPVPVAPLVSRPVPVAPLVSRPVPVAPFVYQPLPAAAPEASYLNSADYKDLIASARARLATTVADTAAPTQAAQVPLSISTAPHANLWQCPTSSSSTENPIVPSVKFEPK